MLATAKHTTIVALVLLLVGCGGGTKGDRDNAMAKALDNSKAGSNQKDDVAKLKKLQARAEEDAQKAYDKELETITTLAPPLPVDVAAACADAGAGLDAFMQKRLTGDELGRWNATKDPDMRKATEECKTLGNLEVGACVAKGLREATIGEFANGSQGDIKAHCQKRYGAAAPAGSPPPAAG